MDLSTCSCKANNVACAALAGVTLNASLGQQKNLRNSRMCTCNEIELPSAFGNSQRNFMLEVLNSSRESGNADVTLTVEDEQFPVHKWVLEANSPYFKSMFQSDMKEALTGNVALQGVTAGAMEAILNFFYLGDTSKIKSEHEIVAVLAASHMLLIEKLFDFCSYTLGLIVSDSNCLYFLQLAEQFKSKILLEAVLNYVTQNVADVVTSSEFLICEPEQLKCLCEYSKTKFRNLDWLLLAVLDWICCDLEVRDDFTQDLLAGIDVELLSELCVRSLLEDPDTLMTSRNIETALKKLAKLKRSCESKMSVDEGGVQELPMLDCTVLSKPWKITFLFEQFHVESSGINFSTTTNLTLPDYYLQVFDISTMTWEPATRLRCIQFIDGACSCGKYIYMVGSYLNLTYIVYDIATRLIEYKPCANTVATSNATLCYFKGYLWLLGGKCSNGDVHGAVYILSPSTKSIPKWYQTTSLVHSFLNPVVLSSENYLYIINRNNTTVMQPEIQCITDVEWCNGEYFLTSSTISIPTYLVGVTTHFYVFDNVLKGFCDSEDGLLELTFHKNQKWKIQGFPRLPKAVLGTSLKSVSLIQNPYVFLSTLEDNFSLPSFVWEPKKAKWSKLPCPSGVCVNLHGGNIKSVWS